jgi:hypothetical protein
LRSAASEDIRSAVIRLLTILMIVTLVIGHGLSYAAAICHHQDAKEHALARHSDDSRTAMVAMAEDAAHSEASKAGTPFNGGMAAWAADMLPTGSLTEPLRIIEPIRRPIADAAILAGKSVLPLLEPPAA